MNFSFPVKIDKDFILSRISELDIFNKYFGKSIYPKKLYTSNIRNDKKPTVGFYLNKNNSLIYHDFGNGEFYNCFSYVMRLYNLDYHQALNLIAHDFNLIDTTVSIKTNTTLVQTFPKKISKIQVEIQEFSDLELKWWEKYGITLEILKHFNIFSCKHLFLNNQLFAKSQQHCPIYGYYGGKIKKDGEKIELWRCYFPKRNSYRFLTNWPSKKIQGFDQLPKSSKLLVITKSLKDCCCFYSMGISAIAPNSENLFISNSVLEDLKKRFKYIIVIYDNDRAGLVNMARIRKEHPELIYTYIPKEYNSKDISDFYKNHGRKRTINLIKKFINWLKNERSTTSNRK